MSAPLSSVEAVKAFCTAGNARFTLKSKKTGVRFTYRMKIPKDSTVMHVGVLRGPDNERSYSYLGTIHTDGVYRHGRRSVVASVAPCATAFDWFYKAIKAGTLPDSLEVWHEGRCGRCGRVLTVPESIHSGIGPECAQRLAGRQLLINDMQRSLGL